MRPRGPLHYLRAPIKPLTNVTTHSLVGLVHRLFSITLKGSSGFFDSFKETPIFKKKTTLVALLLLFCFLCTEADAKKKRRARKGAGKTAWLIGAELGINFGFSATDPSADGSTRQGVILGLLWERQLARRLFLQPEFRYIQKGVNTTVDIFGFAVGGTVKLDSLEIPILFKYKFRNSSRFNPFVFIGPQVSLALKREIRLLSLVTQTLSDKFKSFDLGMALGVGAEFAFSRHFRGFLNLRFSMGFINQRRDGPNYYHRGIEAVTGVVTHF